MKRYLLIVLVLIFTVRLSATAQYFPENYKSDQRKALLYSSKVQTYTKMKRIGIGLGAAGGILTIAGIAMVSSADWETTTTNYGGTYNVNKTTNDPKGATGVIMLVAGIPMSVTGVILGIIGANKVKSYSKKLENLSVDISCTPYRKGVALTYRF